MPDFIGGDPESNASECPAVFVIPETGDFVFRGKTITDPALITELNEHIGKAEDESDVWLPARMASLIRDALDGYERGRQGPGQHTFAELLAATDTLAIRLEMRDSYDETEQGFAEWKATGDTGAYDWGDHLNVIRAAVARGVTICRIRLVSEPLSDYLRTLTCGGAHVQAPAFDPGFDLLAAVVGLDDTGVELRMQDVANKPGASLRSATCSAWRSGD